MLPPLPPPLLLKQPPLPLLLFLTSVVVKMPINAPSATM
jgi:hypothetical protein